MLNALGKRAPDLGQSRARAVQLESGREEKERERSAGLG